MVVLAVDLPVAVEHQAGGNYRRRSNRRAEKYNATVPKIAVDHHPTHTDNATLAIPIATAYIINRVIPLPNFNP